MYKDLLELKDSVYIYTSHNLTFLSDWFFCCVVLWLYKAWWQHKRWARKNVSEKSNLSHVKTGCESPDSSSYEHLLLLPVHTKGRWTRCGNQ